MYTLKAAIRWLARAMWQPTCGYSRLLCRAVPAPRVILPYSVFMAAVVDLACCYFWNKAERADWFCFFPFGMRKDALTLQLDYT